MSSILTALKKLEHEKSLRNPDPSEVGIRIIQGVPSRNGYSMGAFLVTIVLLIFGVGGTYVFMKYQEATIIAPPVKTSKNEVSGEALTVRPLLPASQVTRTEPRPGRPSVKSISDPVTSVPVARTIVKRQPVQSLKSAKDSPQTVITLPKLVSTAVPDATSVVPARNARPALKINGIAFQDGADKVAVVNGITVTNGSIIEGAKVVEIQKDRVKFNRSGERFEIMWDK